MRACFGPTAQRLAVSALHGGLGDQLMLAGVSRNRLVSAAESMAASERLTSREVGVLAYAHGLSGEETALVAFGGSHSSPFRPSQNRVERLACVGKGWWSEPSSRVSDIGDPHLGKMIGFLLGMDFRKMAGDDPLPVPADAGFAALAHRDLGAHWALNIGIRDPEWIETLTAGHRVAATKFLSTRKSRTEQCEDEEDDFDRYHIVNLPAIPVRDAAEHCGVDVCMILATSATTWRQIYCTVKDGRIQVSVRSLDTYWRMRCCSIPDILFSVSSLAEVGEELLRRAPQAQWWQLVALRFPVKGSVRILTHTEQKRRLA